MRRLYPVLFALFPLFGMAARNPGWYRLRVVFVIAALMAAATLALSGVLTLALRSRYAASVAADRAAFVTFVIVALFYIIEPLPIGPVKSWARAEPMLAAIVVVALAAIVIWAARQRLHARLPGLRAVGSYLTLVGALVCVWSLARVLYYPVASAVAVRRSSLVDSLERPVPMRANAGGVAHGPKRDVFVIVLDEYASNAVLRERFGFDNSRFEDSLRALGFRIPTALRSNYSNTLLSVGSLLNFAQTGGIADVAGTNSHDYGPGAYLIEHNRAQRFLKSQGYEYVFFPSTWYAPTRYSNEADVEFFPYHHFHVGRRIYRSEFVEDFIHGTMLNRVLPYLGDKNAVYRDHVIRTLDGVAALEPSARPTFALVHVLMPHTPYVVDASCRPAIVAQHDPKSVGDEIACLDSLVLKTVTQLVTRSRVPPIIVLEGDHGTASLNIFASPTRTPTWEQTAERFRPFGAYYLPAGGGATVPDTTSVVNVLRYVFSYYYGADLPPLPNAMYYSHWRYPYRLTPLNDDFTPVTPSMAAHGTPPDTTQRPARSG